MAILDDLLSILISPVWKPTPGTNIYNVMSAVANELSRFSDLANFVHQQVNITTSEGEFLDIHGLDFGIARATNPFTNQPESDAAYIATILSTFTNVRLNKYVLINLLAPYSYNTPVVYEDMIDCWFVGGNPATDFQPFSFVNWDTISESINLIDTLANVSASADGISFTVKNVAPGRYIELPYPVTSVSPNQVSIILGGTNLQGAFKPGRAISFVTASATPELSYDTVDTFEFTNGFDNVITLNSDSVPPLAPGELLFIAPSGDTIMVNYQDPATQNLYYWATSIDADGTVEIDNSKRADNLPLDNIPDYTMLNTDLLSVRGQLDPMYTIDIILSSPVVLLGDAGLLGQGLVLGEMFPVPDYPYASKVLNVLTYNKLAGIKARIFIVDQYVGDYRANSNNLQYLYG